MNSLQELKHFFIHLGKPVTEFTGHSMKAEGYSWGLLHDNPVRDGIVMSPLDWKAYVKALKSNKDIPELQASKPINNDDLESIRATLVPSVLPIRPKKNVIQATCPHCGKTGGLQGMKIHHFDRCKQKK